MAEGQGARLSDHALWTIRQTLATQEKFGAPEPYQAGQRVYVADVSALLADHDAMAEENARLQSQLQRLLLTYFVCEVCWTNSYEPTEDGPECAMCKAMDFARTLKAENARLAAALERDDQETRYLLHNQERDIDSLSEEIGQLRTNVRFAVARMKESPTLQTMRTMRDYLERALTGRADGGA